ncbi:PAS domain S-box protein [Flavobacterium taihuense]|uniref:histidine kinase n=1 Tax=Flavobacterium taihuense TaxID=2857508 RepID=A0ABS6XTV0_9FLAO|nr:PAS domain S-box protein [Flavobacterium taihuense]MBW4360102.1 PAS domain S-box protein [Flavobacterium taihuense]
MINKIKASLEFSLLVFVMSLFLVTLGVYGVLEIKKLNNTSHELYADRILPMNQLGDIRFYSTSILLIAQQANTKQITFKEARKEIRKAQDSITVNWKSYSLSYLVPKEKQIAQKMAFLLEKSTTKVEKLINILDKEDAIALNRIVNDELFLTISPVLTEVSALLRLQVQIGKKIYKDDLVAYDAYINKFLIILIIAFAFLIPFAFYLIKKYRAIINGFNLNEDKLVVSDLNYRNLIEYAGEAILVLNEDTRVSDLNDHACKLFGYSRQELLKMKISDLIFPDQLEKQKLDIEKIKKDKYAILYRKIKRKDGTAIDTEISNRLIEGKGFFAIIRDVTEQNKIQNLVKESEDKYRYLFDKNPATIIIWDLETFKVLEVNELVLTKYGYTIEEWGEMTVFDYRPEEEHQIIKNFRDRILDKGSPRTVTNGYRNHLKKNGEKILVEITSHEIVYNNRSAILSLANDVTDKIKAKEELKKREEKYRYLFDNNPAYIIIWNLETLKVEEVNEAVLEKYGYSREEWKSMTVLDYRPQEDCERIRNFADTILNNDEAIITSKNHWIHFAKNGETMLMEIASHKIVYNNQPAVLSLGRDVTEQVRYKNELGERNAQMTLFIEHSPAALAMFDLEMKYIAASNRWMADYNIESLQIIGKSHYEVFPGLSQEWKEIHQRCLNGAIESKNEDFFVREDGNIEWLRWDIHPWYKATGDIGGIIMFTEVITEKKRAAEMFKKQFENSPDIILYVNKNYKIELINRGTPGGMTPEQLIGVNCISVLPEESQQSAREAIKKCFETGENLELEYALSHGRWFRSRFVPMLTNDEVTHVMIFGTDLTEKKQAEVKLKQSEEKHRALTENISDAIILVNEKFEIEYQSPSSENISGYSFEEVKLKSVFSFMHPDEYEKQQKFYKKSFLSPGVPMQNQFRIIHKEGHIIWIEGTVLNLLQNENVGAFIINYRNITNRKKLDEQLALTASIVNSSDDAIISKTIDGIITSWNLGAEKVLGYTPEETIGKHISLLLPLDLRGEERKILGEIRKGNSVDHYETKRLKKDQQIIDVSLTVSPIRDVLGNIIGASKIMRDITERKNFEDDLIRYNDELKKANSELDRFVYSASHDLRAPLKSMLGLIHITKEGIEPNDTIMHDRLEMLNGSVEKLDGFIEEILHYSRNARMEVAREVIDFEKLTQAIQLNHKFMEGIENVNFEVEILSEGKFVSDFRRLSVIIANLCSNAIKYKDLSKQNQFVNFSISYNESRAIFIIKDNGIGIVAKDREKIFEMFYRATTHSSGSGLGLYIVKETLEKLGGKITVESELRVGTKFIVEVPNQIDKLN